MIFRRRHDGPLERKWRNHPSGHPSYQRHEPTLRPIFNIPPDDFLSPGLRRGNQRLDLVGFHTSYEEYSEDDDE